MSSSDGHPETPDRTFEPQLSGPLLTEKLDNDLAQNVKTPNSTRSREREKQNLDANTMPWNLSSASGNENEEAYFKTQAEDDSPGSNNDGSFRPRLGSMELLRRLSLTNVEGRSATGEDLLNRYKSLGLSGRIISATICVPHSIGLKSDGQWDIKPRHGTSALFDTFAHLAGPTTRWDHVVVGWTGEIKVPEQHDVQESIPSRPATTGNLMDARTGNPNLVTLRKGSHPFSVDSDTPHTQHEIFGDTLTLNGSQRQQLEEQLNSASRGRIVPIWLYDEKFEGEDSVLFKDQARWRRYAEHNLYTLFHYRQSDISAREDKKLIEKQWWSDYCRLNEKFADRILAIYEPGDVVWIHDYHLMLLPTILRQRKASIYVGFQLHTPFPSSELFRCLAKRKEILNGILGSSMIGFQTYSYSRHFGSCCSRILGFESTGSGVDYFGRHVAVDVFPVGIDVAAVGKAAFSSNSIEQKIERLKNHYSGQRIIVGRDRLDTVRGVAQKLEAFEMLLKRYPEWRGKVVLIQVTSPTSIIEEKEDTGHKIATRIGDLANGINGRYGGLEYTPVIHFPQYLSQDEYFALLRVADLGLITSVRDGMNTTSLEYVVCQKQNCGPLILSEFSGTAGLLTKATQINPWDFTSTADAIHHALSLSSTKRATLHRDVWDQVIKNNNQVWSYNFLSHLMANLETYKDTRVTPELDRSRLVSHYVSSNRRLLLFDYDGTITAIVKDPHAAIPTDRILQTITVLSEDPRNRVWIVSGRDQTFLDEWMSKIPNLGLSAEHGSFIRPPGAAEWENLAAKLDMGWQDEAMAVFQRYTERTSGSFIERKRVALTWHYRSADPELGKYQASLCRSELEGSVAREHDVEVMDGKKNLEVRPISLNKGAIVKRLVEDLSSDEGGGIPPDFVLCSGDDFTDEDMFKQLSASQLAEGSVFTVTVGPSSKQTAADWHLLEPTDVIDTINMLNRAGEEKNKENVQM